MVKSEKQLNALFALQGILIHARKLAHENTAGTELADLLDYAEMLPRFIGSQADETARFRQYIVEIAQKHKCAFILERFDEPIPEQW